MKQIDTDNWVRKSSFNWFNSFDNPCYGFNVKMDITKLYQLTKETKTSFFINFLFIVSYGLNQSEALRLRIINDKVILFDVINPTYTVMTKLGMFENCGNEMTFDYRKFYAAAKKETDKAKEQDYIKEAYNDSDIFDVFYMTCNPWLELESMTHPLPSANRESSSVPRICWDKYHVHNDGKVTINLNITVNHALVDGKDLSDAFNKIQELLNEAEKYIK